MRASSAFITRRRWSARSRRTRPCGSWREEGSTRGLRFKRFRQGNAALFAAAIDATVRLAHERGLLDPEDLAIDSVRLRAHASAKAVRTRTPGRERPLTVSPAAEAMRDRMERKGARERYNRRIATVEPIFGAIEDTMGFRRVSSRLPETVRAEILLKILAHNVARLVAAKRVRCVYVLVDGFRSTL